MTIRWLMAALAIRRGSPNRRRHAAAANPARAHQIAAGGRRCRCCGAERTDEARPPPRRQTVAADRAELLNLPRGNLEPGPLLAVLRGPTLHLEPALDINLVALRQRQRLGFVAEHDKLDPLAVIAVANDHTQGSPRLASRTRLDLGLRAHAAI